MEPTENDALDAYSRIVTTVAESCCPESPPSASAAEAGPGRRPAPPWC